MKKVFAVFIGVLLSACTTLGSLDTEEKQMAAACISITSGIELSKAYAHKLTEDQVRYVIEVIDFSTPICGGSTVPDYDSLKLQTLVTMAAKIDSMIEGVKDE